MDAKRIARTLCIFLVLFGITSKVLASEQVTLQLRAPHKAQYAGYYVASVKGFYQAQGLEVEIRAAATDAPAWRAIVRGTADYAIDNSNAFTAFSQGQPLVALAAIAQQSPSVFLSLEREDLQQLDDLRFRNVMMLPGGQDPELLALLRSHNIALTDLNLFPSSMRLQDLIDGKVDTFNAYLSNEPYELQRRGIPYRVFDPHEKGIHFYSDLLLTHRQRVLDNPRQVEQFRKASLQGWHYALNHPEEALALLKRHFPTDQSLDHLRYELNVFREAIQPAQVPLGSMSIERWQQIAHDLRRMDLIPSNPMKIDRFVYDNQTLARELKTSAPWMIIALGLLTICIVLTAIVLSIHRRLQQERLQREQSEHKLRHLAAHDPLTQLPNRSALIEQLTVLLKLAHRHHTTPALFYIDLDGFKSINETLGQKSGDELLVKFSNRVRGTLRESDIFGRLGSDEFLLIVDESTEDGTSHLAMKLMEQLNKPFLINESDIKISASIGIARYTDCGETADELIRRADNAMFKVKHSFKAGFSLAHPPTA